MTSLSSDRDLPSGDPLDLIEQIVSANEWPYDRQSEQELTVFVAGNWAEYNLHFAWNGPHSSTDFGGLQLVCAFEGRVPQGSKAPLYELMAKINAQMWLGHFDLVEDEGLLMYRHGVLICEGQTATALECENLIEIAITECERFFPAFQFVLWGGKTPAEAMEAALFETVGTA